MPLRRNPRPHSGKGPRFCGSQVPLEGHPRPLPELRLPDSIPAHCLELKGRRAYGRGTLSFWVRRIGVLATVAIAVVAMAAPAAAPAKKRGWQTLRAQGFSVKAPRGYRVKVDGGGYEVFGRGGRMTLLAVSTTGPTRTVAEALLGGALPATPNADQFGLRLTLEGGNKGEIYFSRVPSGVAVTLLEPPKKGRKGSKGGKRRAKRAVATASAQVGDAQRRLFSRMARSARNIRPVALPTTTTQEQEAPISLKPFTTADGSAKAMVPDAPGWVAGGSQGIVEGGHPDLGSYAFGVPAGFFEPGTCFFPPCPGIFLPYMSVRPALEQAWPQWLNQAGANVSSVQVVSEVPGSAGVLGPGFDSGMFKVTFQSNGKPGSAYVIAGTFTFGDGTWRLYYSYIAAYDGVPGTVGDALLRTWQSWDPSVNQAERQAQTFITQQETTAIIQSASEYRRRVFEKTNYNWDAYIRGNDPVLDPVAHGAIGEGGQTLVQGSDGKFFDFSGNQFKKPGT